jgi:ATP-dependent exoDNAse (exonuclease V) beta subunit
MREESNLPLVDQLARDRFRDEWGKNFAVSANAGSGKTTAISERLAAMALSPGGAELLKRTAVVTFTKKAASQIGQRARAVLLKKVMAAGGRDLAALDQLERAFFGTIHSFCLKLAQTYGQTLGINLNPAVVAEDDEALWEEFLEQDAMRFGVLGEAETRAFLRHVPLEEIFPLARQLGSAEAETLRARRPKGPPPAPGGAVLAQLLALPAKGAEKARQNLAANQRRAQAWAEAWAKGAGFLPLYEPAGSAKAVGELAEAWMAPLKRWLAAAAAALAGELAERYRAWRFERGVQTYGDQIDAAMAVLRDAATLDRIRAEGWRIILDEAQDTDPQQFAVLVEVARAPGEPRGAWPAGGGEGPRPGHFCLVGDGQQAIYGSRADIGNFRRHLEAFARGDGGEKLEFSVTFRAPHAVIGLLNATLPEAFGEGRDHNLGPPPEPGAPKPYLQINYSPLAAGPGNVEGMVARLPLDVPEAAPEGGVKGWLLEEAGQVARWLESRGPEGVGAANWGEVCVLAPRNEWLVAIRKEFEAAGLKVALQMRKNRNGDQPAYAWMAGLLAVCCDPENTFEWAGVLREVFAVGDGLMALELKRHGGFKWEEPEVHAEPLRAALAAVRPWVLKVNDEGVALGDFAGGLARAGGLVAKARRLDPGGAAEGELERLLAQAAELGLTGAGPRAWLAELLAGLDDGRPAGKPADDAINLLTAHSAKGLEWPVVIPMGLWRGIGKAPEQGLKLLRDAAEGPRVFFDGASVPQETKDARENERWRELARLLYVTLTRPRRALVLPWAEGWGGRQREQPSFAELWGAGWAERVASLAEAGGVGDVEAGEAGAERVMAGVEVKEACAELAPEPDTEAAGKPAPALPERLLPHQLAHAPDLARAARHESALDESVPVRAGSEEAVDYGLWWHETLEFFPWRADGETLAAYGARRLASAEGLGFGQRARLEWSAWLASATRCEVEDARWARQAELAVFAPLRADAWMDGVIDLVLHDAEAGEVWVLDWKTNRRRAGEADEALLARLRDEYAPQLHAYQGSLLGAFPKARVRAWLYATTAALKVEIKAV